MIRTALIVLCMIPLLLIGQTEQLRKEINKLIRYETDFSYDQTPVSMLAIIDQDSTFFLSLKAEDDTTNVDLHSEFEIGSITKVFTSSLVKKLESQDVFSIYDNVNLYIPANYRNPRLHKLKIWDLVNHYGGFARVPEYFGRRQLNSLDPYAYYTREDLLKYYRDYVPRKNFRKSEFSYSHTGYAILEIIIEEATGKRYHEVLQEEILSPLGMTETFIYFPEDRSLIPGRSRSFRSVKPWHFSSFAASEGIKSDVHDLSIFLRAFMDDTKNSLTEVLANSIIVEAPTNYNDDIFIGNGWHILKEKNKYTIITHTGKTSGHAAFIAFVPETKTGVVILSNSAYGTKNLGFLILRMINDNWNRKL